MAFGVSGVSGKRFVSPVSRITRAGPRRAQSADTRHSITCQWIAYDQPKLAASYADRLRTQLASVVPAQHTTSKQVVSLGLWSSLVGWLVIIGSALYKFPQLVRIWRVRSAKGISVTTYFCETLSIALSLCYALRNRFPFDTYGETGFILVQNLFIIILMSHFDACPGRMMTLVLLGGIGALMAMLLSPSVAPLGLVAATQAISIPLLNASRLPQIILNARTRTTGQLSITTLLLQVLGNAARLFTTLVQLEGNMLYLLSSIVAFVLNSVLVYQYFRFSSTEHE